VIDAYRGCRSFIVFVYFIQRRHRSFNHARLLPHLLYLLRIMFLENSLAKLRWTKVLFSRIFWWIFLWSELIHVWNLFLQHRIVENTRFWFSLYSNLDFSLQFHISFNFSINRKIAEAQNFAFVFRKPILS
jgi:hypothetical protein